LIAALDSEHKRSSFHLIACEPNWIYPLCNTIGAAAIAAYASMTGRQHPARDIVFRQALENEFIDLAGRFVPCRSAYSGFALPMIGGAQPHAMASFFLNATLPDVALRQYLLLRRRLLERTRAGQALRRREFWPIDTGNYRFGRAAAYAGTALAAAEMGDAEVKLLCLNALQDDYPVADGPVYHRPAASVWAHAVEFFARVGRANGLRDLIATPRAVALRPMIDDASYPDVLVARAVHADGMLAACLYPGAGAGRFRLGLSGLASGRRYVCDGTEEQDILADPSGMAMITVALQERAEIRVHAAV
jgi:hypothetical protein